jgi:hypothetical protein
LKRKIQKQIIIWKVLKIWRCPPLLRITIVIVHANKVAQNINIILWNLIKIHVGKMG